MPKASGDRVQSLFEQVGRRRLILAGNHLTAETFDAYVDALARFEPDVLWIYPTAGDNFASLMLSRGKRLKITAVLSSSEMLSGDAAKRISRAFGCPVVDYYGQAERVCMAIGVDGQDMFFEPGYGFVELIPVRFENEDPNLGFARVVATGFWNDLMPLIRYDTGDLIAYRPNDNHLQLEMIAAGVLPFVRIHGRTQHYLRTPSGGYIQALGSILKDVPNVRQAQFVQGRDFAVEIRVLVNDNFDVTDMRLLRERIDEALPNSIAWRVSIADSLERSAGGKTPFVIRRCD